MKNEDYNPEIPAVIVACVALVGALIVFFIFAL